MTLFICKAQVPVMRMLFVPVSGKTCWAGCAGLNDCCLKNPALLRISLKLCKGLQEKYLSGCVLFRMRGKS